MTVSLFGGGGSGVAGDLELFRQALENDWPVPPEVKKANMELAATVVVDGQVKDVDGKIQHATVRDRLKAITISQAADKINLQAIEAFHRVSVSHRQQLHIHKHDHHHGEVTILEHSDWYDNNARLTANTARASSPDINEPGPVQDSELRPPVGQNGNGSHRNGEGPRGRKGAPEGSD